MLQVLVLLAAAVTAEAASVTGCHFHGASYFCVDGDGIEGHVTPAPASTAAPSSYTGCHNHGSETFCFTDDAEVQFVAEGDSEDHHDDDHDHDHHDDHDHGSSFHASQNHTESLLDSSHVTSAAGQTAAVTGCHFHGSSLFCKDGSGNEGYISPAPTTTPSSYTGCHAHGSATFCLDSSSSEVQFLVEDDGHSGHSSNLTTASTTSGSNSSTSSAENLGRKLELSALAVLLALVRML